MAISIKGGEGGCHISKLSLQLCPEMQSIGKIKKNCKNFESCLSQLTLLSHNCYDFSVPQYLKKLKLRNMLNIAKYGDGDGVLKCKLDLPD